MTQDETVYNMPLKFDTVSIDNRVGFDFGVALFMLKEGYLVQRKGWNGKNMFIYLVQGSQFVPTRPPLDEIFPDNKVVNYHAHVDMKTADGQCVPWLCSQTDMLATDWQLYDPPTPDGVDTFKFKDSVHK